MGIDIKGTFEAVYTDPDTQEESQVVIRPNEVEISSEVHDASRGMGAEYVHTVTADALGHELVWAVYEYPEGSVNHVERPSLPDNFDLISNFEFVGTFE